MGEVRSQVKLGSGLGERGGFRGRLWGEGGSEIGFRPGGRAMRVGRPGGWGAGGGAKAGQTSPGSPGSGRGHAGRQREGTVGSSG